MRLEGLEAFHDQTMILVSYTVCQDGRSLRTVCLRVTRLGLCEIILSECSVMNSDSRGFFTVDNCVGRSTIILTGHSTMNDVDAQFRPCSVRFMHTRPTRGYAHTSRARSTLLLTAQFFCRLCTHTLKAMHIFILL